jgi:hypothetical protein
MEINGYIRASVALPPMKATRRWMVGGFPGRFGEKIRESAKNRKTIPRSSVSNAAIKTLVLLPEHEIQQDLPCPFSTNSPLAPNIDVSVFLPFLFTSSQLPLFQYCTFYVT